MPRDFFQKAAPGLTGPSGSVIASIQRTLNALTTSPITVDGIYGGQTVSAISDFQKNKGLTVSGSVSDVTWTALMKTPAPPIFDRCLQLTASFEGTGFTQVVGNFDGAGITWGIIGFTLMGGELGQILTEINVAHPDLLAKAFGEDSDEVLVKTGPKTADADKLAWADSISRGANNYRVADPWKTYFHDLGTYLPVQQMQIDRARTKYWSIAQKNLSSLSMGDELDCALLFDVAVQNGGMGSKNRLTSALDQFTQQKPKTALDRRKIVAQVVADTVSGKFKQDVLDRKTSIAVGDGTIHGGSYKLADWGLLDGILPT